MLQVELAHALIGLMRTSDVLNAFGGDKKAVASELGISLSAVYQWGEYVPPGSAIRLMHMRPGIPCNPEVYKGWDVTAGSTRKRKNRH
jgi:hypothetical protein